MSLNVSKRLLTEIAAISVMIAIVIGTSFGFYYYTTKKDKFDLESMNQKISQQLSETKEELEKLKSDDQYKINQELTKEIDNINKTYNQSVLLYERFLDLQKSIKDTTEYETLLANAISLLADKKYEEATNKLDEFDTKLKEEENKIYTASIQETVVKENVATSNSPPGSGYSRQKVQTDVGSFLVSIISADIGSTRVIVDTASAGTCHNDCPVLSLSDYVSRNGAYAGVNGSYFCPATYPSCAGKTNSFDTLLMNKDKTYFNSDNNVYSGNPAVIFGGGYVRFVSAASQWGRDTSIDSMISNYPLLVMGGNITFGGDSDPKKGSKGNRSFVANKGNQIFIGVVHSATVAESAHTMKSLGMENALNLDDGGSTALWHGGYKLGPGRNLPNAILFVNR
ncbi:phosphodiester glycosidase family protein [Patescibacteria group bacterium]